MAQFEAREIGGRIAQARLEKGMTQEELAEMASFSKRSLQDYEAGLTIPYRQMREIGQLLGKPTEWFLYGDREEDGDALAEIRAELAELRRLLVALDRKLDELDARDRFALVEAELRQLRVSLEGRL